MELLRFVDHALLSARCRSYDREPYHGYLARIRDDLLRLADPELPDTLHGMFVQIFPELEVRLQRGEGKERIARPGIRLGQATVGHAAFGAHSSEPVDELAVALHAREDVSPTGRGWLQEAHDRLYGRLFPLLSETRLHLSVAMLLLQRSSCARLSDKSYLGYDPICPGDGEAGEAAALPPHRVVLFEGLAVPEVVAQQQAMTRERLRSR
jgi:hypothetical protein